MPVLHGTGRLDKSRINETRERHFSASLLEFLNL